MSDSLPQWSMTHDEIAAKALVEEYIRGKLSPEESVRFEEHFVDCPACLDQLESAERFRNALRSTGADAVTGAGPQRPWAVWAVAAALLMAAGASLLFEMRELRHSKDAAAEWQGRYEKEHAVAEALRHPAPLVGASFYLNLTRGDDSTTSEPVNRVVLPSGATPVVLSVDTLAESGATGLRVGIADASGAPVWRQSDLPAITGQTLSVILPSGVLHSGDYTLTLEALLRNGNYSPAGRYRFRVAAK